jgi:hypothetical protein
VHAARFEDHQLTLPTLHPLFTPLTTMMLYLYCACLQIRAQQVIASDMDALEERLWHNVNEYQLTSPRLHPQLTALTPGLLHSCCACLQVPTQQVIATDIHVLEERMWHNVNEYQLTQPTPQRCLLGTALASHTNTAFDGSCRTVLV